MEAYVIRECDYVYNTVDIIGVTDSISKAQALIEEYYKDDEVTVKEFVDVRDSLIEFTTILHLKSIDQNLEIVVTSHNLNEL